MDELIVDILVDTPAVDVVVENRVITEVVEKEVEKVKFGVTIDNILGDVDADGAYIKPKQYYTANLAGVKSISGYGTFEYKFAEDDYIEELIANDLIEIKSNYVFQSAVRQSSIKRVSFDALVELNKGYEFYYFANNCTEITASFASLKRVVGNSAFAYSFSHAKINPDETFPELEEIGGSTTFQNFSKMTAGDVLSLSKVKKITGSSSKYTTPLYASSGVIWKLPSATEFTDYVFYYSGAAEVHFAAANQAAIEACAGYEYKFGATNATFYFDLMLNITVNSVVYSRGHTIGGYTDWSDASGNKIYTDATAEPAVGTVVYSDKGITQVGTVSGVA